MMQRHTRNISLTKEIAQRLKKKEQTSVVVKPCYVKLLKIDSDELLHVEQSQKKKQKDKSQNQKKSIQQTAITVLSNKADDVQQKNQREKMVEGPGLKDSLKKNNLINYADEQNNGIQIRNLIWNTDGNSEPKNGATQIYQIKDSVGIPVPVEKSADINGTFESRGGLAQINQIDENQMKNTDENYEPKERPMHMYQIENTDRSVESNDGYIQIILIEKPDMSAEPNARPTQLNQIEDTNESSGQNSCHTRIDNVDENSELKDGSNHQSWQNTITGISPITEDFPHKMNKIGNTKLEYDEKQIHGIVDADESVKRKNIVKHTIQMVNTNGSSGTLDQTYKTASSDKNSNENQQQMNGIVNTNLILEVVDCPQQIKLNANTDIRSHAMYDAEQISESNRIGGTQKPKEDIKQMHQMRNTEMNYRCENFIDTSEAEEYLTEEDIHLYNNVNQNQSASFGETLSKTDDITYIYSNTSGIEILHLDDHTEKSSIEQLTSDITYIDSNTAGIEMLHLADHREKSSIEQLTGEVTYIESMQAQIEMIELADRVSRMSTSVTQTTAKRKKPYRPCPFCHRFMSKLSLHIKKVHHKEPRVAHAMTLPEPMRHQVFNTMKKEGILFKNREVLLNRNIKDKQLHLLKERKSARTKISMCCSCKGFYVKSNMSTHRAVCPGELEAYALPITMLTPCLTSTDTFTIEERKTFDQMILSKFRNDDVGKVCQSDNLIKIFGLSRVHKVLARIVKRQTLREKLMGDMRNIAKLFLLAKEKAKQKGKDITSCDHMFNVCNMEFMHEALLESTRKADGSLKSGLCRTIGYIIKNVCLILKGFHIANDDPAKAEQFDKFQSVLNLQWDRWFGEAQYNCEMVRQTNLRKPKCLPKEEVIAELRNYNVKTIHDLTSDQYEFMAGNDFVTLRDLLVCRLTLFNARRGGEPGRLLLQEWKDAENDEWISKNVKAKAIADPMEKRVFKDIKVAYQAGKNLKKMVPVLIPKDCLAGIRKIADMTIRQDANIDKANPFLFASTKHSNTHVKGWRAVKNIMIQADITQNITATSMRHRASTIYASLDVPLNERELFYQHMGHSEEINKNVYQAPMAVMEVTKVGKFLTSLDSGTQKKGVGILNSEDHVQNSGKSGVRSEVEGCSENSDIVGNSEDEEEEDFDNPKEEAVSKKRHFTKVKLKVKKPQLIVKVSGKNDKSEKTYTEQKRQLTVKDNDSSYESEESEIDSENDRNECHKELEELVGSSKEIKGKKEKRKFRALWTKEEEKIVEQNFKTFIHDFSKSGTKGSLPGRKMIQKFLSNQPASFLKNVPEEEKVSKIHTKLFNERAKCRRMLHSMEMEILH